MSTQQISSAPAAVAARPSAGVSILVVVVGALVVGGATSLAQTYLPQWAASFANSAGSWTLLTFGLLWWSRARLALSAVLGLVGFVLLLQGYALVSGRRGFPYPAGLENLYVRVSIVAGPVLGLAANLARDATVAFVRGAASAVPAAVLVGEGFYGQTRIGDTTNPVYWQVQFTLGLALAFLLAMRGPLPRYSLLWATPALLLGAAAVYVGYAYVL